MSSNPFVDTKPLVPGQGIARKRNDEFNARFSFDDALAEGNKVTESTGNKEHSSGPDESTHPKRKPAEWNDEPTYTDQLTRYPETVRHLGPFYKSFDLSLPEAAKEYEDFMEKSYPPDAPSIIVINTDKEFSEKSDNWKLLVSYVKVQYRKILEPR